MFADTSYWIALFNRKDGLHEKAKAISLSLEQRPLITTDEVLTEFLGYFASGRPEIRKEAAETVEDTLSHPAVHVVEQSRASFVAGLSLYKARPDKGYSLTDCISMHVMKAEGITDVLTNDEHFTQEGFIALFR